MVERRLISRWAAILGLAILVTACGSERPVTKPAPVTAEGSALPRDLPPGPGRGVYKVGEPYQIGGVWYYPTEDYSYDETGIASWYGPDFHGKVTANGELYDMNDLTAAHRTLPMPSFVRVANLDNGRSIILRVNDRGPYARGRILDISRRGAQLLGFDGAGTAHVRVTIMAEESKQLAAAMKTGAPYSLAVNGAPLIDARPLGPDTAPPPLAATRLDIQAEPPTQIAAAAPIATTPIVSTPPAAPPASGGTLAAPSAPSGQSVAITPLPSTPAVKPTGPPPAAPVAKPPAPPANTPPAGRLAMTPPATKPPLAKPTAATPPRSAVAPQTKPTAPAVAKPPAGPRVYVQAGAFANAETARKVAAKLGAIGPVLISPLSFGTQQLYRVRVGPLTSNGEGEKALAKVVAAGHPQAKLVTE